MDVGREEKVLPMGLARGCRFRRDMPKDAVLTDADLDLPEGSLAGQLLAEQDAYFAPQPEHAVAD